MAIIGTLKESFDGECRVALVPKVVPVLRAAGHEVTVEAGAGQSAGYSDTEFEQRGARIGSRNQVGQAEVLVHVRGLGANPENARADLEFYRSGQLVVGLLAALDAPELIREAAKRGVSAMALELLPRTSRAQSMDVLSSMATVSGYRAVILAAEALPRLFPMLITAAGTVRPARVLVVGAGVAGLQAIATARRLGAVVSAFDVRPVVKQEVESLGAKFVDLPLDTAGAQDRGGYAKPMNEEFYRLQSETMAQVVADSDVVITTAAVPGKKAPTLVTQEMVAAMRPGSVLVDVAADRGGNCAATRPGETVVVGNATVIGPMNLPSSVAHDASAMYAKNVAAFLQHLTRDGALQLDLEDEIVRDTLLVHHGEIVNRRIRDLLGLERV